MQKTKSIALILGVLAMSILVGYFVLAWTEPGSIPPVGNVPAPLNVSLNAQSKEGALVVGANSSVTTGLIVRYGNVGIGTTEPGYKLDVSGNIRSTGTVYANANGAAYFCGGDDTCLYDINVANTIGVYGAQDSTVGSIKLGSGGGTISGYSGNVGIGTTSPGYKLDISGDVRWTGTLQGGSIPWLRLTSFPSACSSGQYITAVGSTLTCSIPPGGGDITAVYAGTGLSGGGVSGDVTLSADTTYLQRRVSGTCAAGSSIRVINSDGTVTCETDDVGGGAVSSVSAANTTLTISPTTGAVQASLNLANANTWTGAQTFNANTNFPGSGIWNTSGNVGIGTASPGAKLEVYGASGTTLKIVDTNQGAGKVLTSDAAGVASWQTPTGGGTPISTGLYGFCIREYIYNPLLGWNCNVTLPPCSCSPTGGVTCPAGYTKVNTTGTVNEGGAYRYFYTCYKN